ncbi:MAG: prepilin peptidase [Lachnospiraceae bacterium]|nr:prepilin peptidase [Lachnospiraceae bacterium]
MSYVCLMLYFGLLSIWDVKRKEIPGKLLLSGLLTGLAYGILQEEGWLVLMGIIPGVLLIFMGFLTREKVGYGDGVMVIILGLVLGWPDSFLVYMLAQFGVLLFAIGLLAVRKVPRDEQIPFAPFLAAGLFIVNMGGLLS